MSLNAEISRFLLSDASSVGADVLTTKFGLWALNSFAHFSLGFIGFHFGAVYERARPALCWLFIGYVLLQIAQLIRSPGHWAVLSADGLWDIAVVLVGVATALALAARGVRYDRPH